jgi:hypothetical protein
LPEPLRTETTERSSFSACRPSRAGDEVGGLVGGVVGGVVVGDVGGVMESPVQTTPLRAKAVGVDGVAVPDSEPLKPKEAEPPLAIAPL